MTRRGGGGRTMAPPSNRMEARHGREYIGRSGHLRGAGAEPVGMAGGDPVAGREAAVALQAGGGRARSSSGADRAREEIGCATERQEGAGLLLLRGRLRGLLAASRARGGRRVEPR